jgi:hypothetical protein
MMSWKVVCKQHMHFFPNKYKSYLDPPKHQIHFFPETMKRGIMRHF